MSGSLAVARASGAARWSGFLPRRRAARAVPVNGPLPPLSPKLALARAALMVVCCAALTLFSQLTFVSRFQHASAQQHAYDTFREQLALGTAPIGPADSSGVELALGAPVAYLEIPELDLTEVVGEGTTAAVLFDGPGHRRDTPLPGQVGTSVILGRRAAFGGPFSGLRHLAPGDTIAVTTGQGRFEYSVLGVRREGDPIPPPPPADGSRLMLATADGPGFLPDGVLRVDADLVGAAVGGVPRAVASSGLPAEEGIMAGDPSTLWALALWLIALTALASAAAWAWHRWGRVQAWITCFPPLLLVGLAASGEAARLLPNLV